MYLEDLEWKFTVPTVRFKSRKDVSIPQRRPSQKIHCQEDL